MRRNNLFIHLSLFSVFIVVVLLYGYITTRPDGKLHIVFCNVGQGDGIYIRFPSGDDMVIDGGPNSEILQCLGKHMAFWDRKIEIVAMTHPQLDHFRGLLDVINRYEVGVFLAPPVDNKSKSYEELKRLIADKKILVRNLYQGDIIQIKNNNKPITNYIGKNTDSEDKLVQIETLWPEKKWVAQSLENNAEISETNVLGASTTKEDVNDFSLVFALSYQDYDVLFTGDAEVDIILKALTQTQIADRVDFEVLKVPHHGSRESVTSGLLDLITPETAVISVGANNRYGHPDSLVIQLLHERGIDVEQTDKDQYQISY